MKNEDVMIVSLAIVVLIVGAIAMLVTGMGINFNEESPVMTSTPILNNTTNSTSNLTTDSVTHDTGISASEVSEENSVAVSYSPTTSSDNSYSGGSSTGSSSSISTSDVGQNGVSESSDSGSSDSSSENSESEQTSHEQTVSSLD